MHKFSVKFLLLTYFHQHFYQEMYLNTWMDDVGKEDSLDWLYFHCGCMTDCRGKGRNFSMRFPIVDPIGEILGV